MARPARFGLEIADAICGRLAGGETLRGICSDDEMPARSTVFRWLRLHPGFARQYAEAREAQADLWADELLEIADDSGRDWIARRGKDGTRQVVADAEHIQRCRLRFDARRWLMGKAAPKKYGEHPGANIGTPDGGQLVVEIVRFGDCPD